MNKTGKEMRIIKVEEMFECPFRGSETSQLSERTSGVDNICLLQDRGDCQLKGCPLKTANTIKVIWRKE